MPLYHTRKHKSLSSPAADGSPSKVWIEKVDQEEGEEEIVEKRVVMKDEVEVQEFEGALFWAKINVTFADRNDIGEINVLTGKERRDFGDHEGTLLWNMGRSEGSQDLQPAPRDSRGEPPIPGPKSSEQGPSISIGQRCLKLIQDEPEDDLEMLVAPGLRQRFRDDAPEPLGAEGGLESDSENKKMGMTPVAERTRSRQGAVLQAPLRQAVGNEGLVIVRVPFSIADLNNWKQVAGNYRDNPDKVAKAFDTMIRTTDPDWKDLDAIMSVLFDSTEKEMIFRMAKTQIEGQVATGQLPGRWEQYLPPVDPDWDPNTKVERELIKQYQKLILFGVRNAIPKAVNWSKLYQVKQNKDESPTEFLDRLKETAQKYTTMDLESEEGKNQLVSLFIGQSMDDIRRKLQKLQGADVRDLGKLLEVAWIAFRNREQEKERHSARLIAALEGLQVRKEGFRGVTEFQKKRLKLHKNKYLGFELLKGQRRLSTERKEAICQLPEPQNAHELRTFLGTVEWCRLWIANKGVILKPLYELRKNSPPEHLEWDDSTRNAFKQLKRTLMKAPALGLPDLTKTFELFVHERQAVALGVLSQMLGGNRRAVAYFSKQLDNTSKGWPGCLRAVAATVLLIQEARKLMLGQKMTVFVPHMVLTVLDQKGGHWLSPSRMLKYQVALLEQDDAVLKSTAVVNPAVFLSSRQLEEEEPTHDCLQTIEEVYSSRPDLKDSPLENPDWELYTDGSSFVKKGIRMSGYAVTTVDAVVEAKALQPKTSAQKAALIALTRALELSEGKRVNIWTDSKYAFGVLHAHGAIWKERGLLSSQGTGIKHAEQILKLLESVQKPREVAIMLCKAHQTGRTPQERGNQVADVTARKVAEKGKGILAIIPEKKIELGEFPN
ncbi:protein NYNRIN-like [Grus japonensis]|uniref:Protein NYNRIN-like n=1 Tax=Grus japonensis TaxID=30415 RepID=A0ABC9YGY4_GRUJA